MKKLVAVGAITMALSGCFDKGAADDGLAKAISAVNAIEVENNSPDISVKSWWRVKDSSAVVNGEICKSNLKLASPYFEKLTQLSTGDLSTKGRCDVKPTAFDRQITKVDVQSDTRAVVTAQIKNVSPPEEGAILDDDDKKAKETGEPFQYVLERRDTKSGWKISKISNFPSYARDWQEVYKKHEPSTNRYVYDYYQ